MARSILVFAVVFSAVVWLMSVGGAQQPSESPPSRITKPLGPEAVVFPDYLPATTAVDAPSVTPTAARDPITGFASPTLAPLNNPLKPHSKEPAYGTAVHWAAANTFGQNESQSLRQQYLELAEQRVGRMTDDELKQGIAEMRRGFLIAQLKAFAEASPDEFDSVRVEIATMALKAKDMQDIQTLIRTLATKLEATIRPASEPRDVAPQPREGLSDDTVPLIERPE